MIYEISIAPVGRQRRARCSSASTRRSRTRPGASGDGPSAPGRRARPAASTAPPARQAEGRLRQLRRGLRLRRPVPGRRLGVRLGQRRPLTGRPGRLPRAGRSPDRGAVGPGLRDYRRPAGPPGHRPSAVPPGVPAAGVHVPAELRRPAQADGAAEEGAGVPGAGRAAARGPGGGVPDGGDGDGALERAPLPRSCGAVVGTAHVAARRSRPSQVSADLPDEPKDGCKVE
jgi:hypothetical protein